MDVSAMTDAEVSAALTAARRREPDPPAFIPYAVSDVQDALADYVCLRAGVRPRHTHPLAAELSAGINRADLAALAAHIARLRPDADPVRIRASLTHSDFAATLAGGFQQLAQITYEANDELATLVWDTRSRGTLPTEFPSWDSGDLMEVTESGLVDFEALATEAGVSIKPRIYRSKVLVSREIMLNDDLDIIAAWTRGKAAAANRLESRLLAELLEANPAVDDGSALFTTNTVATGITAEGLGDAMELLRVAETPAGNKANVRARTLLVHPGDERTALGLVAALHPAEQIIRVTGNPWLSSSGTAYLFGNPQTAPVVARLNPWEKRGPVVFEQKAPVTWTVDNPEEAWDGILLVCEHVTGLGAVSRQGVCRITT